jgi:beta-galactosidase
MNRQTFDLDWEYTEATGFFATAFAKWQPVDLPHDLSIHKARNQNYTTGSGGGYAWSGVITYRKKFLIPAEWHGQGVQIEFEGVYMNAEVSINGQLVALHPYGYTSFIVDLTPHLKHGAESDLVVVVNNSAQPNSRWYSGTGIYRHVWLRTGGAGTLWIEPWGVFVTTPVVDRDASTVNVLTELSGFVADVILRSTILDASGAVVAQTETPASSSIIEQTLGVKNAQLWSVDEPNLYTLISEVLVNDALVDAEKTTFGIRSIAVDAQNGFRLNGVAMKLKGGCVHHDNGLLGAASYDRAEERKIELMKASGYNAIRCVHNPPAPAMLDACDRLGMLVIDETFDCWRIGKAPNDYHLYFEDWWQRDTESMVKRDRNHPSIIMWSIGNEVMERTGVSDGYTWARKQADLIRSLDATRWITSAINFLFEEMLVDPLMLKNLADDPSLFEPKNVVPTDPETDRWGNLTREFSEALDVVGYNYLYTRYDWDGKHFPGRVIVGTESFPYLAYEKETERLPFVIGDFVWTSIDYLGESSLGRVTVDDPTPFYDANPWPHHLANCGDIDICGFKRPQSYYRDLLWGVRTAPFLAVLDPELFGRKLQFNQWGWEPVIDSWNFPGQEGKKTRVDVYSVDEEVELFVNDVSIGRKPSGDAQKNKTSFEVTYEPGTIEVVGYQGGKETGRTSLKTAGAPASLHLTADRSEIHSTFGDLAYVTLEIVDQDGYLVKSADPEVTFEVTGVGVLLAMGTANPTSEELYVGNKRKAWNGRLMAVVRSNGQAGEILLKASAEGLNAAELRLYAK